MSDEPEVMLVVTTDSIEGTRCKPLGPVVAARCVSKSAIADFAANLRNWTIGGELSGYSRMLEATTIEILDQIRRKARSMNADAVVGFRLVTSDVAQGAAELIGYGTAVRLVSGQNLPA